MSELITMHVYCLQVYDEAQHLKLVSPNIITDQDWDGNIFAELEASFSNPSLQYHAIGKFCFKPTDKKRLQSVARKAFLLEEDNVVEIPLRIETK